MLQLSDISHQVCQIKAYEQHKINFMEQFGNISYI